MANPTNGYLGVTEPVSLSGPTEIDVLRTQQLEKVRCRTFSIKKTFTFSSISLTVFQYILFI